MTIVNCTGAEVRVVKNGKLLVIPKDRRRVYTRAYRRTGDWGIEVIHEQRNVPPRKRGTIYLVNTCQGVKGREDILETRPYGSIISNQHGYVDIRL